MFIMVTYREGIANVREHIKLTRLILSMLEGVEQAAGTSLAVRVHRTFSF